MIQNSNEHLTNLFYKMAMFTEIYTIIYTVKS